MHFNVEKRQHGPNTIVRVEGELDIATTPRLSAVVKELGPDTGLVVDLSGTSFIDSTACRYFVNLSRRSGAEVPVRFVCPEDNYEVWRVLELLGLLEALGVEPMTGEV